MTFHHITCMALLLALGGCSTVYYTTMEKLGYQKRDILVDRIEEARDAQEESQEEFVSTLDAFQSVVHYDGGDLEDTYVTLKDRYNACEKQANTLRQRIDKVEDVANALFTEWEEELEEYSSPQLRRASEDSLRATRRNYTELMTRMRTAEARMTPVLEAFHDQVLFLKHNLNARAIASLDGELARVSNDVEDLINDMNTAIDEANAFIDEYRNSTQ